MARSKVIEGLKSAVRHARGDKSQATTYTVMVEGRSIRQAWRTGNKVTEKTTGSIKWARRVAIDYGLKESVPLIKALRHAYSVGHEDGDEDGPR